MVCALSLSHNSFTKFILNQQCLPSLLSFLSLLCRLLPLKSGPLFQVRWVRHYTFLSTIISITTSSNSLQLFIPYVTEGTGATTLVGVGASSKDLLVAGASNNGDGGFIEQYDGDNWVHDKVPGGLLMDAAASEQAIVGVSMWPVFLSKDNGKTFDTLDSIYGLSQDANIFGTGSDIGLVGSFTQKTSDDTWANAVIGVAHSADAGATWSLSEVPGGDVRYGSFPSQVSSGRIVEKEEVCSIVPCRVCFLTKFTHCETTQ